MAQIIDGKQVAASLKDDAALEIEKMQRSGITPGLAVILVGEDPASQSYVRAKQRMCESLNMHSVLKELPATTSQAALLALVESFNVDRSIHGILVQSPLPSHMDEAEVVAAIDPAKDVDGFHAANVAKLAMGDPSGFVPCTPLGCQHLLAATGVATEGAHIVVLGRSLIVGKSFALLMMQKSAQANATVTVVHSRSRNIEAITRQADIVVAAIGMPEFVRADFVREGAVVIDVGVNRVEATATKKGYRLVGDVAFEEVAAKAKAITPVPGGVGPMTIAMLIQNTLKACRQIELYG